MLDEIKKLLQENANWGPEFAGSPDAPKYHTVTGRWAIEIDLPQSVWDYLTKLAHDSWQKPDLRLKNIWFARYQQHDGITPYLWEHMDQPGTQYTIDICIESPGVDNWGIYIDEELFDEEENAGVFFMGQQQSHSRPPYPVDDPSAYVVLLFAHFATEDHWMYDLDAYSEEDASKLSEISWSHKLDGDIRYYEYSGHSPNFNDMPKNNRLCEDCLQCHVVDENFTDSIPGYVKIR